MSVRQGQKINRLRHNATPPNARGYNQWKKKPPPSRSLVVFQCDYEPCGKFFRKPLHRRKTEKSYCCQAHCNKDRHRGRQSAKVRRACSQCGKNMTRWPSHLGKLYNVCSRECYRRKIRGEPKGPPLIG